MNDGITKKKRGYDSLVLAFFLHKFTFNSFTSKVGRSTLCSRVLTSGFMKIQKHSAVFFSGRAKVRAKIKGRNLKFSNSCFHCV